MDRSHHDRDPSITRVESRVGVLHADRRAGIFHGDYRPTFLYERDIGRPESRSTGLIHSSTHDHSLSRPESRAAGMHHSSSAHEHCSNRPDSRGETRVRPDSRGHDHSRPESRCAHDRPESRGPPLCHEHSRADSRSNLCHEHRAGLIHSSSSGFETTYPERVQTSLGLHHSTSGHDSLQLSSSDPEGYPEPPYHSSDLEGFPDRSIFRTHDIGFHPHPSQKVMESPFRFSCPVHSPYRFRFVNGGPDFFGQQVRYKQNVLSMGVINII